MPEPTRNRPDTSDPKENPLLRRLRGRWFLETTGMDEGLEGFLEKGAQANVDMLLLEKNDHKAFFDAIEAVYCLNGIKVRVFPSNADTLDEQHIKDMAFELRAGDPPSEAGIRITPTMNDEQSQDKDKFLEDFRNATKDLVKASREMEKKWNEGREIK